MLWKKLLQPARCVRCRIVIPNFTTKGYQKLHTAPLIYFTVRIGAKGLVTVEFIWIGHKCISAYYVSNEQYCATKTQNNTKKDQEVFRLKPYDDSFVIVKYHFPKNVCETLM